MLGKLMFYHGTIELGFIGKFKGNIENWFYKQTKVLSEQNVECK